MPPVSRKGGASVGPCQCPRFCIVCCTSFDHFGIPVECGYTASPARGLYRLASRDIILALDRYTEVTGPGATNPSRERAAAEASAHPRNGRSADAQLRWDHSTIDWFLFAQSFILWAHLGTSRAPSTREVRSIPAPALTRASQTSRNSKPFECTRQYGPRGRPLLCRGVSDSGLVTCTSVLDGLPFGMLYRICLVLVYWGCLLMKRRVNTHSDRR